MTTWYAKARHRRAARARARNLDFQSRKAVRIGGDEAGVIAAMKEHAARVRALLGPELGIPADGRVLEVGSGAHGLIFFFASGGVRIGIDPAALDYVTLFPAWQKNVPTCAAYGEALPFGDDTFDVVLCDNVIDHAEKPAQILSELARVLRLRGVLYFTVNVHHPIYDWLSRAHGAWNALGLHFEIGPFADHTVHLTLGRIRRLLRELPLRLVLERDGREVARSMARGTPPRHTGDRLKRLFFKNALYEVVAIRESPALRGGSAP